MAAVARTRSSDNGDDERANSLADFKQISLLGEGAYSAVYKVQRLADNDIYALKKVKLPSLSEKEKYNALNEIRLLASVRHENVISYKEAFFDDKTRCLCIVTECANGGDLLQQIQKCQKERTWIKEADVWRYFLGMCHGIKALHAMKVLHRDMKCANIFLSHGKNGPIAKLGDFNVSTVAKRGLCMTQTGTPYYASPEVWRDMPYDGKSDIWSLGCVLYEACALHPPFQAKDMEGLYRRVLRGQYPRIPDHFSQDLADVIGEMLQVNPRHRPSAEQLLQTRPVLKQVLNLGMQEGEHDSDLLSTIKVPRNAIDLSAYLPSPQYDDAQKRSTIDDEATTATPSGHSQVSSPVAGEGYGQSGADAAAASASQQRQAQRRLQKQQARAGSQPPPRPRRDASTPVGSRRERSEPRAEREGQGEREESRRPDRGRDPPSRGNSPHPHKEESRRGGRERDRSEPRGASPAPRVASPYGQKEESRGLRLPRILSKVASRPSAGGDRAAVPRLPRILSTPKTLASAVGLV